MASGGSGFVEDYPEEEPSREQLAQLAGNVLLEFGTSWCGHCQAAQPLIANVLKDHAAPLQHIKVFDGKGKPLGRSFRVKLWPTLILLHNGEEVARVVRPVGADELRQLLAGI